MKQSKEKYLFYFIIIQSEVIKIICFKGSQNKRNKNLDLKNEIQKVIILIFIF